MQRGSVEQVLQNPEAFNARQTSPAGMCTRCPLASGIAKQHRQTVGHHDGARHPQARDHGRIGWLAIDSVRVQCQGTDPVHLLQKNRPHAQGLSQ
jgi:hypothetical protein